MAESENTTVARPYARAAFSQALEQASGLADWSRMLGILSATVSNEDVAKALDNPRLTTDQKAQLVNEKVRRKHRAQAFPTTLCRPSTRIPSLTTQWTNSVCRRKRRWRLRGAFY